MYGIIVRASDCRTRDKRQVSERKYGAHRGQAPAPVVHSLRTSTCPWNRRAPMSQHIAQIRDWPCNVQIERVQSRPRRHKRGMLHPAEGNQRAPMQQTWLAVPAQRCAFVDWRRCRRWPARCVTTEKACRRDVLRRVYRAVHVVRCVWRPDTCLATPGCQARWSP